MNDLVSIEQREVEFYGDSLLALKADDGQIYVSVRHLCDALGLSRQGQVRRIKRQPVLEEGYKGGAMMAPPSAEGRGGGAQQVGVLLVDLVPLWLAGVDTKRVNPEIRSKIERYQREAARVLWEAFQDGRLSTDVMFDELLQADTPAVQTHKMLLAMLRLSRQQVLFEAQVTGLLADHDRRLEAIETALGDPGRYVTPEQASQISQAVKAIAMKLSDRSGRNEYGGVYGELYRRFKIVSYRELPAGSFQEAMTFLREWHQRLTGESPF